MQSILVLSASVLIAVIAAGTTTVNRFFDDVGAVKQHSFHPPLLINPTESGINAWSFGAAAVVTENYVRLTPATNEGHGYLWNQYPSELKAWRAHFSIRVAQRPHLNSVGVHDCGACGVAFWALTEPTRHGDVPFFGVPAHFVGVGVVVHQEGTLHLVGKSNAQDDVSNIGMVSMGRCKLSLSSDVIDIIVEFSSADQNIKLSFMERDSAKPIHCAHAPAIHIPSKYYFGFTAYGKASSPVGYEVLAMTVTPLDGAQEKPIDLKQEQEAAQFDHALDEKEQDFWEANGDQDPEQKAKAEQVKAQEGHHSPQKEQVQDREIPHHAAELRRMPRGAHARDQATQHDAAGTEGDSGSGHADGHVVDEAPPADASGDQPTE